MRGSRYYKVDSPTYKPVLIMLPDEFERTIRLLGMDHIKAAERLGISVRQVQHYVYGTRVANGKEVLVPVPQPTAMLLRLMLKYDIDTKDLS